MKPYMTIYVSNQRPCALRNGLPSLQTYLHPVEVFPSKATRVGCVGCVRQLPNMPKEYIVKLLMDRNHESMIAVKAGTVVGGITFRTFRRQQFAEVAFCAVTASHQVKGYGSRLMSYTKVRDPASAHPLHHPLCRVSPICM